MKSGMCESEAFMKRTYCAPFFFDKTSTFDQLTWINESQVYDVKVLLCAPGLSFIQYLLHIVKLSS